MFSVLLLGSALPVGAVEPPATAHFSYARVTLGGGPSAGLLFASTALRVAVDGSGNVFVADPNDSAVKEIPPGCLTSSCVQTLGGGFSAPFGVAVDGSGNVFVADYGNSAVKEIPPGCTASSCVITLAAAYTSGGGFSAPFGVAVDGSGNVFVADNGNSAVKEILAAGGYTTVNTLAGGFSYPEDVAVDGSGNVFVADTGNGAVKEILAVGGYTSVNALASAFNFPRGVAVDGSGNVFVADDGNNAVEEILAAGGYTIVNTVASGFNQPYGVAVDGNGNIFVADSGNNRVLKLETASVDFGTVTIGQTSATISLTFTIDSNGYMASPVALTQGAAGLDFAVANTGTCTAGTYSAGNTCTVDVTFTPKFAGLRNGAVLLEDLGGNTIATGYVHGIGSGPQVSFLPGSQIILGNLFGPPPRGVAVDGSGNVFTADQNRSAVAEIPPGCVTSSCVNILGSGFLTPDGVAVDGAGNVFVADWVGGAVYEILAAGGYTTVNTLGSGFNAPFGVAVDVSGNVFVADDGNSAVYEILAAGGYTTVKSVGGGFSGPRGVAVDGGGNVFVADTNNKAVKEILAAGGYTTVNTLSSGYNFLQGIAVDGSGNVYVADGDSTVVYEILAAGGYSTVNSLGSGLGNPTGVAVDGSGNVYVADNAIDSRVVKLDYADAPTLTFATPTQVGSTDTADGPQTVTVQNIGNAPLTFQPFVTGNLLDAVLASSGATDCTALSGLQLAAGAACTLGIEFEPAQSGPVTGYVNILDNALNVSGATQQISVSGTGVSTIATAISFQPISPASPTYGQTVTIAVNVTAQSGPSTPSTGSVTFTVDGVAQTPVSIATNGSASLQLSGLSAGSRQVSAGYGGSTDGTYVASSNSTSFTVAQATTTLNWSPSTNSQGYGAAIGAGVLDASVAGGVAGTISYTAAPSGGSATAITAATVLSAGSYTLTANFTPTDATDYSTATKSVSYTVAKTTTALSWTPSTNSQGYGAAIGAGVLDASVAGGVAGTISYTAAPSGGSATAITAATVLTVGSYTLTANFPPTDATDHTAATAQVNYSVTQATPIITWANPAVMPAGTDLSPAQLDATANVPGTFVYSPPSGTVLSAETQTLSVTFTPTDSTDYKTATAHVSLTVDGVIVTSPLPNSKLSSPVQFIASATPFSLGAQIKVMKIYVDNVAKYSANAATINTKLKLSAGTHHITVQAWDTGGTIYKDSFAVTVR